MSTRKTVSDNGASAWIALPADGDRIHASVTVGNGNNSWGGSTAAALEYTPDATADEPIVCPVVDKDGNAVSFTVNGFHPLENIRGSVRISVSNYSGSEPLSIHVV